MFPEEKLQLICVKMFDSDDGQDAAFAKVDENWPESLLEVVSNVPDCEDHQSLHQPSSSPFLHSEPPRPP